MRINRLLVIAAIAAAPIGWQSEAYAGSVLAQGDTSVSEGSVLASATEASATPSPTLNEAPASNAPPPACFYYPVDPATAAALGPGGSTPGAWYFPTCGPYLYASGLSVLPAPVWFPAGAAPVNGVSVPGLLQRAKSAAALTQAGIILNPTGYQMVNFATWLAIPRSDWHPITATAKAGGITATITATPTSVTWDMGDGDSVSCAGPGVIYNPNEPASSQSTSCSYTWPRSSATQPNGTFTVTATINYAITSTVIGALDPNPVLGTAAGPTGTDAVAVTEVEALGSDSNS